MSLPGPIVSARAWVSDHPLWSAVIAGGLLRLVNVAFGFGWFALDDYVYVVEPAWRWLADPTLPYPSALRSELLARAVSMCMAMARALGAEDPATVLRVVYSLLGLWSVAAIPAVYHLTRRRLGDDAARYAAWLMAAYALMPLISTRALIEVVAVVPLCWGLVLVDAGDEGTARRRLLMTAGGAICLGVAAMVRFQVGLLWLAALGWLVWRATVRRPDERATERWASVGGLLAGGLVALFVAGTADVAGGRPFMGTVWAYVRFNVGNPERFGTSAWYTYVLQIVAYTAPPATLWLARPLWRTFRAHLLVGTGLTSFILVHSVIGHKEDRFLFSVLPLVFVLLGGALAEIR
ncbi:MAG: hypothetical protein V3T05_07150, partial [Myxococcota bacterium]